MNLQTLPRAYVDVVLHTTRLPLTVAERFIHHEDDATWPPALAYDAFEANVRLFVGSLLRDDDLIRRARLAQASLDERRAAAQLEVVASAKTRDADQTFQARRAADERKRAAAREKAEARETAAERRRREAKVKAEAQADKRAEQARRVEEDRARALDKRERETKAAAIKKERAAIASAKTAATAKKRVATTDKRIRATKAARRSA